jgi:predicted HTH transcriptional regulator
MPKTRHCAQNRQTSTTKAVMTNEPTNQDTPIAPTENLMINEFIQLAEERQAIALGELETRLDLMGDEFAARVRTLVERRLIAARGKAQREIRTIDVSFFLQAPMETLHGDDCPILEAKTENIQ